MAIAILESVDQVNSNGTNALVDFHSGYLRTEDRIENAFGDFSPGRFMWHLTNVRRLSPPIPARGKQRVWQWEPPAYLTPYMEG